MSRIDYEFLFKISVSPPYFRNKDGKQKFLNRNLYHLVGRNTQAPSWVVTTLVTFDKYMIHGDI